MTSRVLHVHDNGDVDKTILLNIGVSVLDKTTGYMSYYDEYLCDGCGQTILATPGPSFPADESCKYEVD